MSIRGILITFGPWLAIGTAAADEIQIAVSSNFSQVAERLGSQFEMTSAHRVTPIPGSTGKHYAQIRNGAPFDIFLAADALHPQMLEDDGLAVRGSRYTYARGELVLWSPTAGLVDPQGKVLEDGEYRHLAMANPDLAPYGVAAREVLESLGLWMELQDRAVRGENVGQAFQFVASGNAELGFVALSQITKSSNQMRAGSYWRVPPKLYSPIEQQAILLRDTRAAREFLGYLESDKARAIIRQHGYQTPVETTH